MQQRRVEPRAFSSSSPAGLWSSSARSHGSKRFAHAQRMRRVLVSPPSSAKATLRQEKRSGDAPGWRLLRVGLCSGAKKGKDRNSVRKRRRRWDVNAVVRSRNCILHSLHCDAEPCTRLTEDGREERRDNRPRRQEAARVARRRRTVRRPPQSALHRRRSRGPPTRALQRKTRRAR